MKIGVIISSDDAETCWNALQKESEMCPISTMKDMYEIIKGSDKVVTF
jgi:hypothetical protein